MARAGAKPRRKARLRTELSEADEERLREAVALFGLPKAEVVRRLIRAAVQAGPALSAENTRVVAALASETRAVGRNLNHLLRAVRGGGVIGLEDTELVWRELHGAIAAINDELTEMTFPHGSKLRRHAGLGVAGQVARPETTVG